MKRYSCWSVNGCGLGIRTFSKSSSTSLLFLGRWKGDGGGNRKEGQLFVCTSVATAMKLGCVVERISHPLRTCIQQITASRCLPF